MQVTAAATMTERGSVTFFIVSFERTYSHLRLSYLAI